MTAYFNYHGGGFPLDQAAYTVTEDAVIINVAGVAAPIIIDEPMDAQRFGEAVVAADVHFRWPGRGLPRCGTSYQIDPALYSYFNAVTVRWAGVEQRLEGDEAAAFLRAAGVRRQRTPPAAACPGDTLPGKPPDRAAPRAPEGRSRLA